MPSSTVFNPYPFVVLEEAEASRIAYQFTTDHQVTYQAVFSDYDYMFGTHDLGCQLYTFDLIVIGSLLPPPGTPVDSRIGDTVSYFFRRIFERIDNVVIAVYDSSDQHERQRARRFASWANKARIDYVERVDFDVDLEDYPLLATLFHHVDLPNRDAVLERYELVLAGGNIPLD